MSVLSEAAAPSLMELGCLFNTLREEVSGVRGLGFRGFRFRV